MKKTYMTPSVEVVRINHEAPLLMDSLNVNPSGDSVDASGAAAPEFIELIY